MNKEAYLNELKNTLRHLSLQEQQAALSFCEEMLADRMEAGMTEEEAVAAMESPALMAEKLALDIKQPPRDAQSNPAVNQTQTDAENPNQWQKMQLKCAAAQLNHIDLQAGNLPIKIQLSQDDQVTLTYFTRPRNVYEARQEGDTLLLREIRTENSRSFFNFFFNFDLGTLPRPEITLEVPADLIANLKAATKNGAIALSGPQMLMHVELSTTNGGLALQNTKCISLDAHTTNGGVAASLVECRTALSLRTTNGGVAVSDCHSQAALTLSTTNGGVTVTNCTARDEMRVSSTNGGLKVQGLDAGALHLRTSNSSISGTVQGPQSQWQIESHTTNGKNSLPAFQQGAKPFSAHTTNSPIRITFS